MLASSSRQRSTFLRQYLPRSCKTLKQFSASTPKSTSFRQLRRQQLNGPAWKALRVLTDRLAKKHPLDNRHHQEVPRRLTGRREWRLSGGRRDRLPRHHLHRPELPTDSHRRHPRRLTVWRMNQPTLPSNMQALFLVWRHRGLHTRPTTVRSKQVQLPALGPRRLTTERFTAFPTDPAARRPWPRVNGQTNDERVLFT